MDWFSWLSQTGLEPSLVYEYGLSFAQNELEEEDIVYFNHEFLQSMGISIAKHRLEILKLARKEKKNWKSPPAAVSRLFVAIKRTKKFLANYMRTFSHCEESALVVVPTKRSSASYGTRWKSAMVKRNKKLIISKQERLFLTNGSSNTTIVPALPVIQGFSGPVLYCDQKEEKKMDADEDEDEEEEEDGYWSTAMEDIRSDDQKLIQAKKGKEGTETALRIRSFNSSFFILHLRTWPIQWERTASPRARSKAMEQGGGAASCPIHRRLLPSSLPECVAVVSSPISAVRPGSMSPISG